MPKLIIELLVIIVAFTVAGVIGYVLWRRRILADAAGLPQSADQAAELEAELLRLRRAGVGFRECIDHLVSRGMRRGSAEMLVAGMTLEERPDASRKDA